MANPEYFRLLKDGRFVGFKRVITEYLAAGHGMWRLTEEPHDEEEKLSSPSMGIENLKRESVSKMKAELEKTCRKANKEVKANESRTNRSGTEDI